MRPAPWPCSHPTHSWPALGIGTLCGAHVPGTNCPQQGREAVGPSRQRKELPRPMTNKQSRWGTMTQPGPFSPAWRGKLTGFPPPPGTAGCQSTWTSSGPAQDAVTPTLGYSQSESLPLPHACAPGATTPTPTLRIVATFFVFFFFPSGADPPPGRILGARLTHNIQTTSAASFIQEGAEAWPHTRRQATTHSHPVHTLTATAGGAPGPPPLPTALRASAGTPQPSHQ